MRTFKLLLIAAFGSAMLAACGSPTNGLTGKEWQLTAITERVPAFQGVVPPEDQSKYTITFHQNDKFDATADCNRAAGTYKATDRGKLTIDLGASTMVVCPEASYSELYLHALGRSESYEVAGDILRITLGDGGILTFTRAGANPSESAATAAPTAAPTASPSPEPTAKPTPSPTAKPTAAPTSAPTSNPTTAPSAAPTTAPTAPPTTKPTAAPTAKPTAAPTPTPPPSSGLTGKTWTLTALTLTDPAFQGVIPTADQGKYTVTFATDGTFSAQADCNQVAGTYTTTSSGGLTVTPGPSTIVACADGSYGDLYILGLSNAASYVVAGSQLTITLQDGGTLTYQ
jgi:heat shock protein HslJ